ncbi:MAG TPA: hypothetical protein DEB30_03360 [Candidatus Peribacter riflensis]|uniref:DUF4015 domain-containing protein n=1 Tax=Candidatus Peribacter riflensis TaxID=1735162 RepID=A0A0S1SHY5_9BACT|nr:MAG: hypothetical protein PeribacterA2_0686 [Candidatus Peribacter riflensis]OGJ79007.1 MAG: hypothetical protein A2398_04895 [Candidatus Peribacteria bacterium RIFOXYB1_FULL_57_12]OGJ80195.1 MAG: hypothetical protein A2412_04550 [Candidatus Peribacteria bacterium RIFOXYC1_FULL_58_8]ALM11156.1 MAG: hypothetical protein PeribacterB2_0687 [Candidatus Peribacter riflensis]ALM12259.1 MAG: hypothetical protein PeribacterC2_0687 [Candidatus Peribacter riflensis]
MPDESTSHAACLSELQNSTHDAAEHALSPSPGRFPGGPGTLALFGLMGFLMFGLGASVALFQHDVALPVFARQIPENFDRTPFRPRHIESTVEQREIRLHSAPEQEAPPEPIPAEIPSSASSSSDESVPEEAPLLPAPEVIPFEAVPPPPTEEPLELPPPPAPEEEIPPAVEDIVPPQEPAAPIPSLPPLPPQEIGVFFTQSSVKNEKYFLQTLDRLSALTGSALIFNVKAGTVHFHAAAPMANELDLVVPSYDLPEVIRLAHERGVTTIARFVALKDPNLAQSLPDTQMHNPKTGRSVGNVWVDPSNEQVLMHNEQILRDVVAAGIDEINLDYIRYPTEYAQTSVGLKGSEKADRIEAFLLMARRVIDESGGHTKLGISTYAILGWNFPVNFEPLGQDIARFAPLVDVISPMAYPATFAAGSYYNPAKHPRSRMYYLVYRTLTGYRELLGDQAYKLRPWIQGYGITQKNLRDQIDAVFDSGSCGFTIWNASNEYGTFMKMLPEVQRPDHCVQA